MRLGTKLAALALILLLPKTNLYFTNTGGAEAPIAPARPISGLTVNLKKCIPAGTANVSAEREQAQSAVCAAANADPGGVLIRVADTWDGDEGPTGRPSR